MQRHFGQIRTSEALEMFTKLWYNKAKKGGVYIESSLDNKLANYL